MGQLELGYVDSHESISGLLLKPWPLGLELRGIRKDVEYLEVCPKPLVDITEQGYESH